MEMEPQIDTIFTDERQPLGVSDPWFPYHSWLRCPAGNLLIAMRPEKKKIVTNPVQTGLNTAFAGLNVSGLPAGPEPAPPEPPAAPAYAKRKLGRVLLRRETAHRGGKTVIVVHDFPTHLSAAAIEGYAKKLRAACGCGGTIKDRQIEVQGDQAGKIRALLEEEGFQVGGER
jgi:translation initiation factor 1